MPAIIVAAAIGAAGAVTAASISSSGASQAAKTQAKSQNDALTLQQQELDAKRAAGEQGVALKSEALSNFSLPGILDTEEGKSLLERLKLRESGVGVGYRPEIMAADTAATAAQTRASLREQTIPAINTAASARGLGRSTIPVSMTGQATQAAERDIESRIAQLQVASEAQRSTDIQNAITMQASLNTQQTQAKQAEAGTKLTGEFNIADTEIGNANSNFAAVDYIGQLISQQGATAAANQLQQAALWAGAIQSGTSSMSNSIANQELLSMINQLQNQNQNNSMVNIASTSQYQTGPGYFGGSATNL